MTKIDPQVLDQIVEQIVKVLDPEKIILFGSYVHGEAEADSDVDIAVIAETHEPRHKVLGEVSWNLRDLHLPMDIILYSPERWHYFRRCGVHFPRSLRKPGA